MFDKGKIMKQKNAGRFRKKIGEDIRWKREMECVFISILTHMLPKWQKKDYKGIKL